MTALRLLTLVVATFAVYANTLAVPFYAHDRAGIVSNLRIRELWPGPWAAADPVLEWSYALNYAFGGLEVVGYHAGNILLHVMCGLLLYDVVRRTLVSSHTEVVRAAVIAWWAALIFLVHPLQTEAVTLVSGRRELLAAGWTLAMLELALVGETSARWRYLCWSGAVVACALGLGTSAATVTNPLVLLWLGACVLPRPRREYVAFGASPPEPARSGRWPLHLGALLTWIVLAWLLVTRARPGSWLSLELTPLEYLRTQLGVTWHYLGLLVWPARQSIEYDWARESAWLTGAIGWSLVLLLLGWLVARGRRAASFWLGFAVLALAPTSTVLPLDDLVSERRMYLALAGFAVLAALAGAGLARRAPRAVVPLGAVALIVALGVTAFARNQVWRDPIALWRDALATAPTSERVFRELAASYARRGDRVRAARVTNAEVFALEQALARNPLDPTARIALGRAYGRVGRVADALAVAHDAVRMAPTDPSARATLGALLLGQARPQEALEQLEIAQALADGLGQWIDPDTARNVCTNLGWAYASVGRPEEALAVLRRAAEDDDVTALNTLGTILGMLGEWDEARQVLERAHAKDPDDLNVRRSLGWVYGSIGRFAEATALLEGAIIEQPNEPRTHAELGWLRLRAGRPAEAVHAFSMAVALEPGNAAVLTLLGIARGEIGEWAGAVHALERAVQLAPRSPLARENLNRARRQEAPLRPSARTNRLEIH